MSWDQEKALKRAKDYYAETDGITVSDIVRETEFDAISLRNPRRVLGAHLYVDVPNFRSIVDEGEADTKCLRLLHLYAREVARVVCNDFDATLVHFQGPRLHALAYRPIGDDSAKVTKAVLTAAAVRKVAGLLADEFDLDTEWTTAGGVDFGSALVTRDGVAGDRELLFLGSPANQAAKIIKSGLLLTDAVADLLPDDIRDLLVATDNGHQFRPTTAQLETLAAAHKFSWTAESSTKRLCEDGDKIVLDDVVVRRVEADIDKSRLGLSNSKLVEGVSLFADVDGFTAYIERCEQLGCEADAVRAYHVFRAEMRNLLVTDFGELRLQYQGDRMQGIVYHPYDEPETIALAAITIAAALNSLVEDVLPQVIGPAAKPLAIGLAAGRTILSKFGQRGNRDIVSLGSPTLDAARIQERLAGRRIGIDKMLRDALPEWAQSLFPWDAAAKAYVAKDLTLDVLERQDIALGEGSVSKMMGTLAGGAVVGAAIAEGVALVRDLRDKQRQQRQESPLRPWHRGA